ncbi:hypothetical protein NL676_008432 [Syzygium grande]|nr:hypothetical protein NL676_008432 [Syzygium grande]
MGDQLLVSKASHVPDVVRRESSMTLAVDGFSIFMLPQEAASAMCGSAMASTSSYRQNKLNEEIGQDFGLSLTVDLHAECFGNWDELQGNNS